MRDLVQPAGVIRGVLCRALAAAGLERRDARALHAASSRRASARALDAQARADFRTPAGRRGCSRNFPKRCGCDRPVHAGRVPLRPGRAGRRRDLEAAAPRAADVDAGRGGCGDSGPRQPRVEALLRSLPKEARRSLIPIAARGGELSRARGRAVHRSRAPGAWLHEARGVPAASVRFDPAQVPAHLTPQLAVIEEGRDSPAGTDLADLRRRCAVSCARRIGPPRAGAPIPRRGAASRRTSCRKRRARTARGDGRGFPDARARARRASRCASNGRRRRPHRASAGCRASRRARCSSARRASSPRHQRECAAAARRRSLSHGRRADRCVAAS